MIIFNWYAFNQLTNHQLYDMLALRASVFVVDQCCYYLDPDGKDQSALHLLGIYNNELVAYLRLLPPTNNSSDLYFGRVVTANSVRGLGFGKQLINELLTYCDNRYFNIPIKCSAQQYLQKFYESFGFTAKGEVYDEAGIPHIFMERIK